MIEYDVRSPETGGTAELVKLRNSQAQAGWRLVSAAAASIGISAQLYSFFEREIGEQRPLQDAWRSQHRGEDNA